MFVWNSQPSSNKHLLLTINLFKLHVLDTCLKHHIFYLSLPAVYVTAAWSCMHNFCLMQYEHDLIHYLTWVYFSFHFRYIGPGWLIVIYNLKRNTFRMTMDQTTETRHLKLITTQYNNIAKQIIHQNAISWLETKVTKLITYSKHLLQDPSAGGLWM